MRITGGLTITGGLNLSIPIIYAGSGGTLTTYTSGGINYRVHTFTANGTFTVNFPTTFDYLIVGGGGGGGTGLHNPDKRGYPGYGGDVLSGTTIISADSYEVIVGGGGAGGINNPNYPQNNRFYGLNGGASSFNHLTAGGGNGGIQTNTNNPSAPPDLSVSSDITGTSIYYGLPGSVTTPSQIGASGTLPGQGGDGGGLGNFSGGAGYPGVVIIRYAY